MKQKSGFLAFLVSAIVLWILSLDFVPFIEISFGGRWTWFTILILAIVLGLINLIVVALIKKVFKNSNSAIFIFIVTLLIDAGALMLANWIMGSWFSIVFWPHAIIAAAILALVCTLAGLVKD